MTEKKNIHKFFPQPIFQYQIEGYEEHNKNLEEYIYSLYESDKTGVKKSNVNGWHSKPFNLGKMTNHHLSSLNLFKCMLQTHLKNMVGDILQTK